MIKYREQAQPCIPNWDLFGFAMNTVEVLFNVLTALVCLMTEGTH